MTPAGFPHSDISGSKSARDSPKLFAACHVLHRLLAPRHPPRALCSLTPQPLTKRPGTDGSIYRNCSDNTAKSKISKRLLILPITIPVGKVRASPEGEAGSKRPPAVRWSVASRTEDTDQGIDAVATRAAGRVVETRRLELLTLSLQRRCSAN